MHGTGQCNKCDATGYLPCRKCANTGGVICRKCGGTGSYQRRTVSKTTPHLSETRITGIVKFYPTFRTCFAGNH